MARTDTLGNFLTDICDAVREKTGETGTIKASELDTKIQNISSSTNDITVTYYAADEGVTPSSDTSGFNITVNSGEIADYAFYYSGMSSRYGKSWLRSVHIGNKVEKIGAYAFKDGPNCTIAEDNIITEIGGYAFNISYGDGFPKHITFPILEELPEYCFSRNTYLETIDCPSLVRIGKGAFSNCKNLQSFDFTNIQSISSSAFSMCTSLKKVSIPNLSTAMSSSAYFSGCSGLIQFSCNISGQFGHGNNNANAPLHNCTALKAAWISTNKSKFDEYAMGKGALYQCTGLQYLYINYPRTLVEAHPGYSLRWSNDTVPEDVIIVCNDDEGWMTQEEFDAIDWATYSGETTE